MGDNERDLVASEGVDEGSAASVLEGAGRDPHAGTLGAPAVGAPDNSEQQAAPDPVEADQDVAGPGQRNEVGEG